MLKPNRLKRLCAGILVFLVLAPAVAARDDEVGFLAFLFNSNPHDDSMSAVRDLSPASCDCDVATLLWRADHAQVRPFCIFSVEISSAFLNPTTTVTHRNRSLTVHVGRAPPAA